MSQLSDLAVCEEEYTTWICFDHVGNLEHIRRNHENYLISTDVTRNVLLFLISTPKDIVKKGEKNLKKFHSTITRKMRLFFYILIFLYNTSKRAKYPGHLNVT